MVAFVPPSGNDPPFLATWPMDYIASAANNALLEIGEYSGRKHADGTLNTN